MPVAFRRSASAVIAIVADTSIRLIRSVKTFVAVAVLITIVFQKTAKRSPPHNVELVRHEDAFVLASQRNRTIIIPSMKVLPVLALLLASTAVAQQTLHVSTKLVIVDVVVTDAHGQPVKGLKQSDFHLLEGKSPQTITHFDEHSAAAPAKPVVMPKLPPGIFTNFTSVHQSEPVNILLLDTLNTPIADQSYVRDQMLKYLKTSNPATPMAIFGLTSRLLLLQSFTSDPAILKSVIDKKSPGSSILLDPHAQDPNDVADDAAAMAGNTNPTMAAAIRFNAATFETEQQSFALQLRIRYTLDALSQLARYLAVIPGRKNLIWFSGAFPINILPDGDSEGDKFAGTFSMGDELHDTSSLLSRAQVAVYPIDARGLMVSPTMSAANPSSNLSKPGAFSRAESRFSSKTQAEHGTMEDMARATGGRAFYNTNGLAQAVATAIDSGSNYYTLTYTPTDPNWNGAYRTLHLQLDKSTGHGSDTLAYRRGYYATDPDTPHPGKNTAPVTSTPDAVHAAALFGGPSATEILFKVAVLPASKDPEPAAAATNQPDPKATGPWLRYLVQFAADIQNVVHTDDKNHLALNFLTIVYDADGKRINSLLNTVTATPNADQLTALRKTGFQLRQQISVPTKGDYFIRVLINDHLGTRVGATEVPIAAVRNLPPVNLPPPTQPPAK